MPALGILLGIVLGIMLAPKSPGESSAPTWPIEFVGGMKVPGVAALGVQLLGPYEFGKVVMGAVAAQTSPFIETGVGGPIGTAPLPSGRKLL